MSRKISDLSALEQQALAQVQNNKIDLSKQKKNSMVPKPPKPGEYIYCQVCGKKMLPEDFSKDPKIRQHEFKWHLHHECENKMFDLADRQTHGLMAERNTK